MTELPSKKHMRKQAGEPSNAAWLNPWRWPEAWSQGAASSAWEYWVDSCQRSVLALDVLRKRGNIALEHSQQGKPPVLAFDYEMIMDGREMERPCNYALLRILPQPGTTIDPAKRPFVIVDPRAGHGPGIGGSKPDSQVGAIMNAGHTCYFVTFFPVPEAGQTLGDVALAEYHFLQKVNELHPDAPGKPCVVGNCQAGWAVFILSAAAPDAAGPITLNGSPLSYWQGPEGKDPMRFVGGLMGGTWMSSLFGDLGNGKFDGAYLVQNFENLNPANTLWSKHYNLYSKVDTEEQRFLDFEKWWGGLFLMNAEEMRFITNSLFVGNKLQEGAIRTPDNQVIDIRNIRSPIVIFASWGDNITPPQQALGWIAEVYDSVDDIRANEQVIVYALHKDIGHLGIFVSGRIAKSRHATGVENIDIIDVLPPGLYESVIEPKDRDAPGADLTASDYVERIEARTMEDLRALLGERKDDEARMFETVSRVSEINEGMYLTFMSPWVKMLSNDASADMMRQMQPHRAQNRMMSDSNPAMSAVKMAAEAVRKDRRPVAPDNPFLAWEKFFSNQIVTSLNAYRDMRDQGYEQLFKAVYSSPWLQAAVGLNSWQAERAPAKPARDLAREALMERRLEKIRARINQGGFNAALVRMLEHVVRAHRSFDPRILHFAAHMKPGRPAMTHREIKELFKEQGLLMWLEEDAALAVLPKMLPTEAERRDAVHIVRAVMESVGSLSPEEEGRFAELEKLLDLGAPKAPAPKIPFKVKAAPAAPAEAPTEVAEPAATTAPVPAAKAPAKPTRAMRAQAAKAATTPATAKVKAKPAARGKSRKTT